MRVLHTIHSLNPLHGGTSYGLRGMVEGLLKTGVETEILVLDEEASPWFAKWPCEVHAAGRGIGQYGFNRKFDVVLEQIVGGFDHVVVHGLWQYHGQATRRACLQAGIPYEVFPHGMLDQWFSRVYLGKHLLKQLYWGALENRLLRDAATVFFTTQDEFESGRDTFFPFVARPAIAPFGIQPPEHSTEEYKSGFHRRFSGFAGKRTLLFLSRLHPKKGCDLLIEGFARWQASLPSEKQNDWHLRIVGPPDSDAYLEHLRSLVATHELTERGLITFVGNVDGENKWQEISQADALVLPSHQENFGVIIAEALACGVPVLISNKVNGWNAIQEAGAGLVEQDTVEGVIRLLNRWERLTPDAGAAMRLAARQFFAARMSAEVGVKAFLSTVQRLQTEDLPQRFGTRFEAETRARLERHLKVLHVCSSISPASGGPSFALPLMANSLAQHGVQVDVITTDDDGPGKRLRSVIHAEPVACGDHSVRYFPKQTELYRFSWSMACWLFRNVRDYDFVHIHGLFAFPALVTAAAARIWHVPYAIRPLGVLQRWGMENHRPRLKKLSLFLVEKPMIENASFVHYTCDAEMEEARALGICCHWVVLPLGINPANYERLPSKDSFHSVFPRTAECKIILFLSRVDPKKGVELLIDALPQVLARNPDAILAVAGVGDSDYIYALKKRAENLGVSGRIVWCGFVIGDLKLSAFRAARLFVLPSYSENFGLALLEAMACGAACVASRQVGLTEAEEARETLAVCDTNVESLASSICTLLEDDLLCENLGAQARALALKRYSMGDMMLRLKRVYELIAKGRVVTPLPPIEPIQK